MDSVERYREAYRHFMEDPDTRNEQCWKPDAHEPHLWRHVTGRNGSAVDDSMKRCNGVALGSERAGVNGMSREELERLALFIAYRRDGEAWHDDCPEWVRQRYREAAALAWGRVMLRVPLPEPPTNPGHDERPRPPKRTGP